MIKDAKRQLTKFEQFAALNGVIPLPLPMTKAAVIIQSDLKMKGSEIGNADPLIAGIVIISDLQLVNNNTDQL